MYIIPKRMWTWDDTQVAAFDFETSGAKPEFALQPWRIARHEAWATSLVWLWPEGGQLHHAGGLHPSALSISSFFGWALSVGRRALCGWNLAFDLSVALAYGVPLELLCQFDYLDGMLLWRHLDLEPDYDDRGPKRNFRLKTYVRQFIPEHAGYEENVDYHSTDPAELEKLHTYNIQDNIFTLRACKALWARLGERQRAAAWIEGHSLPLTADGNLRGLLIDTVAANDLKLKLERQADEMLGKLAEFGMTEQVVRSPLQLARLMFGEGGWGLKPLKYGKPHKKTGAATPSTDKETLHELGLVDERVRWVRAYREALGNSKKFAQNPLLSVDYNGDGCAHPLARVFGTYSGRLTYASKQKDRKGWEGVEDAVEEVADAD